MKFWIFATLALAASCDSCMPEWFRATPKAGFERVAKEKHRHCIATNECFEDIVKQCHDESWARCLDAGYEKSCGDGDIEGSCGSEIKR